MCELTHCLYWRRNWWVWNSSISSLIHHWRCRKQPPVEGVLLYWSFSLLLVFQPRFVSSAYSSVSVLKLMGESFTAYETTTFPLAFPTDRSPNKSLQRALPHCSSVSTHVFLELSSPWRKLQRRLMHHSRKVSSYWVPLKNVEAMND